MIMANKTDNPFAAPRESKSVTITFRITPSEHAALLSLAKKLKLDSVGAIRAALAALMDEK